MLCLRAGAIPVDTPASSETTDASDSAVVQSARGDSLLADAPPADSIADSLAEDSSDSATDTSESAGVVAESSDIDGPPQSFADSPATTSHVGRTEGVRPGRPAPRWPRPVLSIRVGQWIRLFLQGFLRQLPKIVLLVASVATILMTIVIVTRKNESRRFMTNTRLSIMDKEVRRACKHIEKNFIDDALNAESLCESLVTGRSFLEALFERELGMSVGEFIDQVRINRARMLLQEDGDSDPQQVASETGFGDTQTFLRTFERITGATYFEYIKAAKNLQQSA